MTCHARRDRDGSYRCFPCRTAWDSNDDAPPCNAAPAPDLARPDIGPSRLLADPATAYWEKRMTRATHNALGRRGKRR